MIVAQRHPDELYGVPALATLAALSASIDAFVTALDLTHPRLRALRPPQTEREQAAMLLYMHLDACQGLLSTYDALTFEGFPEVLFYDAERIGSSRLLYPILDGLEAGERLPEPRYCEGMLALLAG